MTATRAGGKGWGGEGGDSRNDGVPPVGEGGKGDGGRRSGQ